MSTQTAIDQDQIIKEAVSNTIAGIKENPDGAKATFKANSKLEEGYRAEVNARDFQFISDEPENLGGTNKGPNPVEYVLGALAACQELVIKTHATQLDINLESVEVTVSGDIDLYGFFNVSDTRAGFSSVSYETTINAPDADPEKLEELKKRSVQNCPVLDIIQNNTPVDGSVHFVK